MRAISVELIKPPISTIAIGEKSGESSNNSGVMPPIAVALVSSTGRKRTSPAVSIASRNGGTSAYWWRDGLPLAAACPTQTPGLVSDLARPITLQPNEGLRVTLPNLSLHDIALPTVTPDEQIVRPQAIVYLSFTGYAVVEA